MYNAYSTPKDAFSSQMVSPPPKCPTYVSGLQRRGSHEDPGPASQRRSTRVARWQALRERRRQAVSRGHRYPRWQVCSQRISVRRNPYQPVLAAFSVVTLDSCVRNFSRFTGYSLGEAIKRACTIRRGVLGLRIGRARSAPVQTQTWSFLIAVAMCLARGSGARRFGTNCRFRT